MAQRETPERAGKKRDNSRSHNQLEHEWAGVPERLDQQTCRNVGHDHDRNDPTEDEPENGGKNDIGITGDIEEIEIAVNKTLGANDPEADRGKAEHDGI